MKTVCVMGLGYIGLPTASLLATSGRKTLGVDINQAVVDTINAGQIHIHEPDLEVLVRSAVNSGNLTAALQPAPADVFIIAVPTPFTDGHTPDLSYVDAATKAIAEHLTPGNLVVLESTSPVGTSERIALMLHDLRPDLAVPHSGGELPKDSPTRIFIAHCPERVLPGSILRELIDNDRIVGGVDEASAALAAQFYESFATGEVLRTDARTAELAKLAENAYRDVNIAFANELANVCRALSIDVWRLIELANRHPRVEILKPGPGVGGHCIAVDPWFIVHSAPDETQLIRTAREVNDSRPDQVVQQVRQRSAGIPNPTIACLGLAYKADIDDLRESPAVRITRSLVESMDATILAVEPHIATLPRELKEAGVRLSTLDEAIRDADVIVVLAGHRDFLAINRDSLDGKIVVDTRGIFRSRKQK